MSNLLRVDNAVELVFRYKSKLQCSLLQSEVVVERLMCDLARFVIVNADSGRKGLVELSIVNLQFIGAPGWELNP